MDTRLYLGRIGYSGAINPDAESLRELHTSHMLRVPFENLDIGRKQPLQLTREALWDKIVVRNRGGFCYELNGLFAWLLRELGYEVTCLNARVFNRNGDLGIDFDHLALFVQIPGQRGRWLVDVGFGDSFSQPLDFDIGDEQVQGLRSYRLEPVEDGFVTWQKNYDGAWRRQYFFDLEPHRFPDEYAAACLYHQTSAKSSFTRSSIVSRVTPDGRVSLEDGRLILTRHGQRSETRIESKAEYDRLLEAYFGISFPEELS